jgi:hypothetical protein
VTGDLPAVTLQAGQSLSGSPQTPTLVQQLAEAAGGGQATYDFFSSEAKARKDLAALVAQGPAVWTLHDTAADLGYEFLAPDQPAYVATAPTGQLVLQTQLSPDVLQADSADYQEAGIATMYLVTDQCPIDVFTTTVNKLGPGIAATALGPAIATLLGALKTFVTSFFTSVSEAAGSGGSAASVATEAAETAAEAAEVDGEIVADELALSVEFGPLAIVGLVIAALTIVYMILSFGLSKTMTAWIRVFNVSAYPLQLGLAHNYNLSVKQEPTTGLLPPPGTPPAPPGVTPQSSVIFRADYVIQNDSSWEGLGIVLQAPPSGGGPGVTVAMDIPSVGPNSLAAVPSGTVDPGRFYDDMEGQNTSLSTRVGGGVTVTMGTNQNSGESPSPLGGDDGYNYEYVVVVS